MSSEQELNSLDRFRKQPGRLILEEHSHCEVPAGCGGVVLRWRNPQSALPLTIYLYTPVQGSSCFIDGAAVERGRIDLIPGKHVLTIEMESVDLSLGLLLFAATHEREQLEPVLPDDDYQPPVRLLSAADGTWKYTLDAPPDGWTALDLDDSQLLALAQRRTPRLRIKDIGAYRCRQCARLGADCLGLPQPLSGVGNISVRKVFEVPFPDVRER
jgi:hypothetical protein